MAAAAPSPERQAAPQEPVPAHAINRRLHARDVIAMGIPLSSDSEADEEHQPAAARRSKIPLADLVSGNHELYNTFMKNKMPKLLRELANSSDTFC